MDFRIEIVRTTSDAEPPDTIRQVFRVSHEHFAVFMAELALGGLLKMSVKRDDATPWTP